MSEVASADPYSFAATSRRVEAGPYSLHYHEAGSGPALLMLHGSGPGVSGWSNFRGNLPVLAQHFRVLILDQPGFGLSAKPVLDQNYIAISSDAVRAFLDTLAIESVSIVGNSMGGGVATRFTLDHPVRVDKLVLMGPGGVGVSILSPEPSEGMRLLFAFNQEPTRERMEAWVRSMVSDPKLVTDELLDERMANAHRPGVLEAIREIFATFYRPEFNRMAPLWSELHALRTPTLLMWGQDDRVVPVEQSLLPFRRMPNADLIGFARCGHWVQIERKADFERHVISFVGS